ncbi:MAG: hypothetical protein EX271_07755 [Acidimicrobiales bacterium]|nr:Tad domain-containing protein [Hyphomonadaceae bacterium]RZV41559.1 MAG: hypothetical protein EX271_07755 [Acidimicrobiales bacterium]
MSIKDLYTSYIRDTQGNFAMMFGVLSVPILIATGMAIDISRLQSFDSKLQDAADAAAIFGTVIPDGMNNENYNQNEFEAKVREIFELNLGRADAIITEFDATPNEDGSVSVSARAHIPATFAQIGGFPRMHTVVGTDADADSGKDLEIVIAFDTTNSMGFGSTWTTAMNTLSNVLLELEQYTGSDNFYVTLLPFSDRVNIGTTNSDWLSAAAPVGWNGCVEPREFDNGTVTWAIDAAKPNGSNKFDASIVGVTGGLVGFSGSYPYCPSVAITGPTSNVAEVITAANAITKSGTGRFDVAMAWAWRVLAKKWRTEWPGMPNSFSADKERRQIAILVTDGKTEAYTWEVDQVSSWGWNNGSVGGFENMVAVCDGMKDENMEIFMVRVNGNVNATGYMQDCASTPDHYYEISTNADLELALVDVVKVVKSNVRLTE